MKNKNIITKAQCLIDILEKNGFKNFIDSSSRNDLCESIINKDLELQIYLPNSKNNNFENKEWNTFAINEKETFIQDLDLLIDKWNPILEFMNSIGCEWD